MTIPTESGKIPSYLIDFLENDLNVCHEITTQNLETEFIKLNNKHIRINQNSI